MGKFENSTLLIVDDEAFLRELLAARLQVFGAKILMAENGQVALDMIQSEQVDAVLTDIEMPVMTGLELLSRIRELGLMTPVVILTGVGDQTSTLTALRLGATDFLDKPFESDVVHDVMAKALEIGTAARSLENKQISAEDFRLRKAAMLVGKKTT